MDLGHSWEFKAAGKEKINGQLSEIAKVSETKEHQRGEVDGASPILSWTDACVPEGSIVLDAWQ